MSLEDIRLNIDSLDAEIVRLLDARARSGREAAELKRALDLPLHDPAREEAVVARAAGLGDGSMPARGLAAIFRTIMAETLDLEEAGSPCRSPKSAAGIIDAEALVMENTRVAPGFFRMRLKAPELAGLFRPGQFFQLRLGSGDGPFFLRRPFAPSEFTADGLAFVYALAGGGTGFMATLPAGTRLRVLAPLGNAFTPLPSGGAALLVGGGCGGPSLATLARRLREDGVGVTVVMGARTETAVLEERLFAKSAERFIVSTDDGSRGCRGTVADACRLEGLAELRPDRVYACGPHAMLKATAALAAEWGVPCEVSLEERMACGFGACVGCAVAVRDEAAAGGIVYRRVCHDGPVFDARALAW